MQNFYETGFYERRLQLGDMFIKSWSMPLFRKLCREGRIDDNEYKPLTLTALLQSFALIVYSVLFFVIVSIGELTYFWMIS